MWRRTATFLGFIIGWFPWVDRLLGVPGMIDDARTWSGWLGWILAHWSYFAFPLVGIGIIVWANLPQIKSRLNFTIPKRSSKFITEWDTLEWIYKKVKIESVEEHWRLAAKASVLKQLHQKIADGEIQVFGYHQDNPGIRVEIPNELFRKGYVTEPELGGSGGKVWHRNKKISSDEIWHGPEFLFKQIKSAKWESPKAEVEQLQQLEINLALRAIRGSWHSQRSEETNSISPNTGSCGEIKEWRSMLARVISEWRKDETLDAELLLSSEPSYHALYPHIPKRNGVALYVGGQPTLPQKILDARNTINKLSKERGCD